MESVESSSSSSSPTIENPPLTKSEEYSVEKAVKSLEQSNPWIQQAIHQAFLAQDTVQQTFDSTIAATHSRLSQIRSTSSAHFHQTLESVKDLKADYDAYEAKFFSKVKEGVIVAASHPFIAAGAVAGLGVFALKGPRRFLYYRSLRLFSSEEVLLSRADGKLKELKQSFESYKAATEKLEKRASHAEEEMKRGRTKLRQAGYQIRKSVLSADKIEKQGRGLKYILANLPRRQASLFNSQIKNIVAEAKEERKVLAKEVTKISNYGISI
ncbi:hypothetical protein SOVF_092100 [Spinacia oleracea]|uniref:RGS1-HXK1-interacting protein 1 n=1 Tax=Spinacia oleracea TaxID=3562 RepID=A0A9R0JW51_SPIOL|nr:RGS1-HXK1-interacting protein 1 [Spinacia oleracea]KNA16120.1 hypothetical protein SOVF_092100 [Spinacia oleracea]